MFAILFFLITLLSIENYKKISDVQKSPRTQFRLPNNGPLHKDKSRNINIKTKQLCKFNNFLVI